MTQAPRVCASCAHPVRENQTICKWCLEHTQHRLANQAAFYNDLEIELSRMARKLAENDGGRASSATQWQQAGDMKLEHVTPAMLKEWDRRHRAAAEAIHAQRSLLVSWVKLLVEEDYLPDYPADSIPALSCAIESVLSKFRSHEAAGELVREVRALCQQIVRIIDRPEHRSKVIVGPCCESYPDGDEGYMVACPGEVEAVFPADESEVSSMRCLVCKVEWQPRYWIAVGERIMRRADDLKKVEDLASKWRKAS